MDSESTDQGRSRVSYWLGVTATAVALVAFFVFLGFPYDRLVRVTLDEALSGQDTVVAFASASPNLEWLGPGFEIEDVVIAPKGAPRIRLNHVALRPAWSFSWFRGTPAFHASLEAPYGNLDATVLLEDPLQVSGSISLAEASLIPLPEGTPPFPVRGPLELGFEATGPPDLSNPAWNGTFALRGEDGSIALPDFPVAIPYDELESLIVVGQNPLVEVQEGRIGGPLVNATLAGTIKGKSLNPSAALEMQLIAESKDESVQKAIRNMGLDVDSNGRAEITVTGTVAKPNLR